MPLAERNAARRVACYFIGGDWRVSLYGNKLREKKKHVTNHSLQDEQNALSYITAKRQIELQDDSSAQEAACILHRTSRISPLGANVALRILNQVEGRN